MLMMGEAMVMVTELHRHKYKLSPVSPTLCRCNQLGTAIHDPALFGALSLATVNQKPCS